MSARTRWWATRAVAVALVLLGIAAAVALALLGMPGRLAAVPCLGSGVPCALEAWLDIDFRDDRDGELFAATVRRKAVLANLRGIPTAQVTAQVTEHVVALVKQLHGELTRTELQDAVGLTLGCGSALS